MIKNILSSNEDVKPNSKEMEVLRAYFPQCFTNEGKFDIDVFQSIINDSVDITHEGYSLDFLGKSYAKLLASTDTTTVIKPDIEHNLLPENVNSENIYISGDNLDGLKHLLKSYSSKVKCIYIDPPYNTGSDGFVYNDNFNFTVEDLVTKLSISDSQAQKILDLTKRGSASHSAWLMFMASRLQLAKDLLTNDGVIFISIDDNEQANLKLLCDNIFGEENFVGNLIWKSRQNKDNRNTTGLSVDHEYILLYSNNENGRKLNGVERRTDQYTNPDNDHRGSWASGNMVGLLDETQRPNCHYDLINPKTNINYGKPKLGWRYDKKTMSRLIEEERILWPINENGRPRRKVFLNELSNEKPNYTSVIGEGTYTRNGTAEIDELFGFKCFDFPKSTEIISELLQQCVSDSDVILDFFSGSATTAHSIMQLNAINEEHRKYIMVQLPEFTKEKSMARNEGYLTIDQIGMERIKRAAKKIKEDTGADIDYGFKHYTLLEPSSDTIDKMEKFDPNEIFYNDVNILEEFGKETVLETWLVKDGYGFGSKVEIVELNGYLAYYCGNHLYLIDGGFTEHAMVSLIDKYNQFPSFTPEQIVLFGYSFSYIETDMIKKNILSLKDKKNIDIRY